MLKRMQEYIKSNPKTMKVSFLIEKPSIVGVFKEINRERVYQPVRKPSSMAIFTHQKNFLMFSKSQLFFFSMIVQKGIKYTNNRKEERRGTKTVKTEDEQKKTEHKMKNKLVFV